MVEQILFAIFALATCGSAVAVVISQNVVRMAFWLITSLGSTAGLFFLLGADFVGATQLLVYVGGTLVLLIFGVMLTASGPFVKIKTSPADGVVAAGVGAGFLALVLFTVNATDWKAETSEQKHYNQAQEGNTARTIGTALWGIRPDKDLQKHADEPVTPGYLLPFEIVSVHLLVVLIGAAYLARAKRRAGTSTTE